VSPTGQLLYDVLYLAAEWCPAELGERSLQR